MIRWSDGDGSAGAARTERWADAAALAGTRALVEGVRGDVSQCQRQIVALETEVAALSDGITAAARGGMASQPQLQPPPPRPEAAAAASKAGGAKGAAQPRAD